MANQSEYRRYELYVTENFKSPAPSRGMYHIVYFLESIKFPNRHYIGYTANLKQRILHHNQGLNPSTKIYKPWKVIYAELYLNKKDALGREKFLKSGSGWKFLKKQINNYLENH